MWAAMDPLKLRTWIAAKIEEHAPDNERNDANAEYRVIALVRSQMQCRCDPAQWSHPGMRPIGQSRRGSSLAPSNHDIFAPARGQIDRARQQGVAVQFSQGLVAAEPARLPAGENDAQDHAKSPGFTEVKLDDLERLRGGKATAARVFTVAFS